MIFFASRNDFGTIEALNASARVSYFFGADGAPYVKLIWLKSCDAVRAVTVALTFIPTLGERVDAEVKLLVRSYIWLGEINASSPVL